MRVVPILMYHEIATRSQTASRLAVPPGVFAAQLAFLHAEGFTTLTASALAAAVTDGTAARGTVAGGAVAGGAVAGGAVAGGGPVGRAGFPARPVVLTFDDGFADFHREALPLLQHYGFTATLFVTTGWIHDAGPYAAGRMPGRMLSWSQILEAADSGVEVGAHSHRHPQLDQLADADLRRELRSSMALLEDRLGRAVPGMAYPFGYSNARVRRVAAAVGHRYACVVANVPGGPAWEPFALPRLTIRRSTRPDLFAQIMCGRSPHLIFIKDRTLTKAWAGVRRSRAVLRGVSRNA